MKSLLLTLGFSLAGTSAFAAPPTAAPRTAAPPTAHPKPASKPAKPVAQIDPKARQIVGRAATLYGPLKSMSIGWSTVEVAPDGTRAAPSTATLTTIDWEKRGRIRLQTPSDIDTLTIVDGKKKWTLEDESYSVEAIAPGEAASEASLVFQMSDSLCLEVTELLEGDNFLSEDDVNRSVTYDHMFVYNAKLLGPQVLGGEKCDLVEVDKRHYDGPVKPDNLKVDKKIYWFAQKDGRLTRLQIDSKWGKNTFESSDTAITKQQLNPVFTAATFAFTPPKGIALKK